MADKLLLSVKFLEIRLNKYQAFLNSLELENLVLYVSFVYAIVYVSACYQIKLNFAS